jgi:cell pole-organizing protein PopZ
MADNSQNIDQGKLASDAQNIAKGDAPNTTEAPNTTAQPQAIQQPQNTDANTEIKRGPGRPPSAQTKEINQPSPGALKPGAVAENAKPGSTQLTAEQIATGQKEELTKFYGPDYVTATKDGVTSYFSRRAWDLLGENKEGWKMYAEPPQEVKDLQQQQQKAGTAPGAVQG